jgi:hypothetical protein
VGGRELRPTAVVQQGRSCWMLLAAAVTALRLLMRWVEGSGHRNRLAALLFCRCCSSVTLHTATAGRHGASPQ